MNPRKNFGGNDVFYLDNSFLSLFILIIFVNSFLKLSWYPLNILTALKVMTIFLR